MRVTRSMLVEDSSQVAITMQQTTHQILAVQAHEQRVFAQRQRRLLRATKKRGLFS